MSWAHAFESAVQAVATYGGAARGDRTMLDALLPALAAVNDAIAEAHGASSANERVRLGVDVGCMEEEMRVAWWLGYARGCRCVSNTFSPCINVLALAQTARRRRRDIGTPPPLAPTPAPTPAPAPTPTPHPTLPHPLPPLHRTSCPSPGLFSHESHQHTTDWLDVVARAAHAAHEGSRSTANMVARAGRSSYLPPERLRGIEDPGATAAAAWLHAVYLALTPDPPSAGSAL